MRKKVFLIVRVFLLIIFLLILYSIFNKYKNKNWQFYTNKNIGTSERFREFNEIVFEEDNLFFNSQNFKTYSLNKNNGIQNWEFRAQDYSPFPPLI
ncbi:MAG: hypothetical protein OEX81_01755, partial [Candidatus Pacebacteria bacterium]|nr:hypothetical protein [Candidatus Paceibacterota bacterium]